MKKGSESRGKENEPGSKSIFLNQDETTTKYSFVGGRDIERLHKL